MTSSSPPLVSVVLAVHNGERYIRQAIRSVLRQTVTDLEVLVVDDASDDTTSEIVAAFDDRRLTVLGNDRQLGLASSLNRALDKARGRYVARLDADDVAMPRRLERQLKRITSRPMVAAVGSAVAELDDRGRLGAVHAMPTGPVGVRWTALFSSPFFHPSVLVDREALERHELRYDPEFLESEDYDLWTRLLAVAEGDNLRDPLVLYRVHRGQASQSRRDLQRMFQLRVALREIGRIAPELAPARAELAWRLATGEELVSNLEGEAAASYVELVDLFERQLGARSSDVREAAARTLVQAARRARASNQAGIIAQAIRLDPALPVHSASRRARRQAQVRAVRRAAESWLADLDTIDAHLRPIRVVAVFPEPTPYRSPLLDRVAALPELDLTVLYAARSVVAGRTWDVEPRHRAVFLRGASVPGAQTVLRHDYPVTPGIVLALRRARPDVVVVSGWSTFAAQAAIAWCRLERVPYVLLVESHDEGPRPGWRRAVKGTIVPPIVTGAAGILVTGSLARSSMISRGARSERIRVFANTIDVQAFEERADRLAVRRPRLRDELGCGPADVLVLFVGRLAPEKRLDVLVRAVGDAGDPRLVLVLVGDGPERGRLERLAREQRMRLVLAGDWPWERIVEAYVAADVFALLSERETWAVVVNEAAACGLPLVLSDRVGAAHDLLRDGDNGSLVAAGDVEATALALRALAADPALRRAQGARSRELARDWGYGPSVAGFLAAVREAVATRGRI